MTLASGGPRRIGVFGGTFDPPHIAHLVAAIEAREVLELDVVLLVVANVPWQKEGTREISSAEHRLEMVRACAAEVEGLEVSDMEIRRGDKSYTADTLAELLASEPQAELFVIVGRDAAAGFTTWERHDEVAQMASLVVVDRPGQHSEPDPNHSWIRVDVADLEISSTDLRARIKAGRSIKFLIPEGAASVIERLKLYR
ncbi:MAG: nicotinate-nucleotide adenylyltransferase [Acidimicrobiales bacterium]|nr:nicotinate-nucleotide adenylyltransferase [Acidimicrobiales bacterium]